MAKVIVDSESLSHALVRDWVTFLGSAKDERGKVNPERLAARVDEAIIGAAQSIECLPPIEGPADAGT